MSWGLGPVGCLALTGRVSRARKDMHGVQSADQFPGYGDLGTVRSGVHTPTPLEGGGGDAEIVIYILGPRDLWHSSGASYAKL